MLKVGALREAENKIKWTERVARSVAPQRSPDQRVVQRLFSRQVDNPGKKRLISTTYRKIPKISPGAYIFRTPFLRGLYSEGLIYGGKFAFQNRLG